jgi:hypothetical protein
MIANKTIMYKIRKQPSSTQPGVIKCVIENGDGKVLCQIRLTIEKEKFEVANIVKSLNYVSILFPTGFSLDDILNVASDENGDLNLEKDTTTVKQLRSLVLIFQNKTRYCTIAMNRTNRECTGFFLKKGKLSLITPRDGLIPCRHFETDEKYH